MSDESDAGASDQAESAGSGTDSNSFRSQAPLASPSIVDLLNRLPLLCDPIMGDQTGFGAPMRTPDGELVRDDYTKGFLMGPLGADLAKVAEAGRSLGDLTKTMLENPNSSSDTLAVLGSGLLLNLGHGGTFDYQRVGSYSDGFTQYRQFRDIADVNVGLFAQQAGLSKDETLSVSGFFARNLSSNTHPSEPYSLDPRTRVLIEQGYALGESGAFNRPRPP